MKKLVILSGQGSLPFIFKNLARENGYIAYTVGVKGITSKKTDFTIPFLGFLEFEQLLRRLNNPPIVMLGKFNPKLSLLLSESFLFKIKKLFLPNLKKNYEIFKTLKKEIKVFTPKEIINAYISYMEEKGFNFLPSKEIKKIATPLLAKEGTLNSVQIDNNFYNEGKNLFKYAKNIADMDIGQTIVFKHSHIIAVEGIEGTNETIKRACKLVGKGFSIIKVGRTHQDFRVDVPTVGLETLDLLIKCKAKAIFLEADNVFIVDKEKFLKKAQKNGIAVIGLKIH